ncbi:hypothetical protein ABIA09_001985 [Bradyrhizobium yuanmingense]
MARVAAGSASGDLTAGAVNGAFAAGALSGGISAGAVNDGQATGIASGAIGASVISASTSGFGTSLTGVVVSGTM